VGRLKLTRPGGAVGVLELKVECGCGHWALVQPAASVILLQTVVAGQPHGILYVLNPSTG
jgi:hypothetical protein